MRIPVEFNRTRATGCPTVMPALELYRWLLEHGRRRPLEEQQKGLKHLTVEWLGPELGADLSALWDSSLWIPQESLGFERLIQRIES